MSDTYVPDKDLVKSMQHAMKSGFQDHPEANISTSFMSKLPAGFGKVMDRQELMFPLPAVKTLKIWNH